MPAHVGPVEPEFFGAAAGVAGTVWAITTTLFAFISGWVIRTRLLTIGVLLVILVGSFFVVTISNLLLSAMMLSLGALLAPGASQTARIMTAVVATISFFAPIGLLGSFNWTNLPKDRNPTAKEQKTLDTLYWTFLLLNFVIMLTTWFLTDGKNQKCLVCLFLEAHLDSLVVIAIGFGCLLPLLLALASTQATLLIAAIDAAAGVTVQEDDAVPPAVGV